MKYYHSRPVVPWKSRPLCCVGINRCYVCSKAWKIFNRPLVEKKRGKNLSNEVSNNSIPSVSTRENRKGEGILCLAFSRINFYSIFFREGKEILIKLMNHVTVGMKRYMYILSLKILQLLYHLPLFLITLLEIAFISDRSISFWTGYGKLIFVQMFLPFRELVSINHRDIETLSIQRLPYPWKNSVYREFQFAISKRFAKKRNCIKLISQLKKRNFNERD